MSTELQTNGVYKPWSNYMRELFASRAPPGFGSVNAEKLEEDAREKLKEHPSKSCCL